VLDQGQGQIYAYSLNHSSSAVGLTVVQTQSELGTYSISPTATHLRYARSRIRVTNAEVLQ